MVRSIVTSPDADSSRRCAHVDRAAACTQALARYGDFSHDRLWAYGFVERTIGRKPKPTVALPLSATPTDGRSLRVVDDAQSRHSSHHSDVAVLDVVGAGVESGQHVTASRVRRRVQDGYAGRVEGVHTYLPTRGSSADCLTPSRLTSLKAMPHVDG